MASNLGFIYYLQNPNTGEIFYVGSTQCPLNNRLRTHYQHLREFEKGLRGTNKRYVYLQNLRPFKATIHLLEIVTNIEILDSRESYFIKYFRQINPNLTNMTDGGRGQHTSKYYTEKQMEEYSKKISKANKGRKKPIGFAENMSVKRIGLGNPAVKIMKIGIMVCFKDNISVMFKYGFEVNEFTGSKSGYTNLLHAVKNKSHNPYGYIWKKFDECTKEIQDIVQSNYESS